MKQLLQLSSTIGVSIAVQSVLLPIVNAQTTVEPIVHLQAQSNQNTTDNQTQEFAFDFNNTFDYAACLDVILLAYEQRYAELENAFKSDCATKVLNVFGKNLSQEVALKLVKSADFYATEELESPLYPTLGLRRRIAINLGYVYETDKNNPDILKYVDAEVP
ncbi:MAG: hypothetical protein AAF383_27265 [Cyanobacteria bacterium P01_A01_bin.83]